MSGRDPYKTLGVPRSANADEIKKAYRRLVRQHHPDANPDDPRAEERFKEIQQAYETVSNPRKRGEFDRSARVRPNASRQRTGYTERRAGYEENLQDLLKKFGAAKAQGSNREVTREDVSRLLKLLGAGLSRKVIFDEENSTVEVNFSFGKPRSSRVQKPPRPPKPPKP